MPYTPRSARAVIGALAPMVAASALIGLTGPAEAATMPAKRLLNKLDVASERPAGYDRAKFKHWVDADSDGCDTREAVLIAESKLTAVVGPTGCTVQSGRWVSWYDDEAWTNPSDVDIDHVIPLKEAWDSGATDWTAERRSRFANDLAFAWSLDAVTDNVNQSKGERDPGAWWPAKKRCAYAIHWIAVKFRWDLAVDRPELRALTDALDGRCGKRAVARPARAAISAPTVSPSSPAPVTTTPVPVPTATTPAPTTPAPAATVTYAVTPGAFCSEHGSYGYTSSGTLMRCTTTSTDSRYRWRSA